MGNAQAGKEEWRQGRPDGTGRGQQASASSKGTGYGPGVAGVHSGKHRARAKPNGGEQGCVDWEASEAS